MKNSMTYQNKFISYLFIFSVIFVLSYDLYLMFSKPASIIIFEEEPLLKYTRFFVEVLLLISVALLFLKKDSFILEISAFLSILFGLALLIWPYITFSEDYNNHYIFTFSFILTGILLFYMVYRLKSSSISPENKNLRDNMLIFIGVFACIIVFLISPLYILSLGSTGNSFFGRISVPILILIIIASFAWFSKKQKQDKNS